MPMTLDRALADETTAALNDLANRCLHGEARFRAGAAQAGADDVRALLRRRAEEYKMAAAELQAHVRRLGAVVPARSVVAEACAEAPLRSTLASHTDHALLDDCERLEDALLERYADTLARPLEPAAKDVIDMQRLETRRQHEQLRAMRDRIRGLN